MSQGKHWDRISRDSQALAKQKWLHIFGAKFFMWHSRELPGRSREFREHRAKEGVWNNFICMYSEYNIHISFRLSIVFSNLNKIHFLKLVPKIKDQTSLSERALKARENHSMHAVIVRSYTMSGSLSLTIGAFLVLNFGNEFTCSSCLERLANNDTQ